ncbi:GntR family transcriptional regulator [Hansschlegelia zhihuaiae]|uniref:GntR family transcriptional regulator n=1 Tax=Hansschlegelia zhihuaiae TaxID=405005 RepID=A0A4V1KJH1_9HYPH|nr:GntR family transcriptional regulator [Hansschlegelia zhihuaiae]RXF74172.1 GntR family transcriptional regulator [Hansschlegelia zhihuaiae]
MTFDQGHESSPGRPLAPRPLYQQARELLVRKIIDGVWGPGGYLPSEQQLAREFGVSIGTLRKATDDLVDQGLLERQHGRGTQVVAHSSARSRFRFLRFFHADGRLFDPVARLLRRTVRAATAAERTHLALEKSARVVGLTRIRSEAGEALVFERIALPADLFLQLELDPRVELSEEVYVFYQRQCGVTIVRAEDQVALDAADAETAQALGLAEGAAVLRVRRVAYGLDGRRVEHRESWTAKLRYQVELD